MCMIFRTTCLLSLLACALALQAQTVDEQITQCATKLAKEITGAGLKRVGVPEMTTGAGDQLGGNTGSAGQYFAGKLGDALATLNNGAFVVEERNRLNSVLQEGKLEAGGLTDPKASKEVLGKLPGLDGLVDGTLTRFDVSHTLEINCRVIRYPEAVNLGGASVKIDLDPDLLGMFGVSFSTTGDASPSPTPAQVVQGALQPPADAPAPDIDLHCPYGIEVLVQEQPKPLYEHDGHYYVPAAGGETFAIRLTNRTDRAVAVALFIDGLNTIKEEQVLPSQADKWVVKEHSSIIISGWQIDMENRRDFVFVNSDESLAAHKHYCDKLGLITASFFPLDSGSRDLGTGSGDEHSNAVTLDQRIFSSFAKTSLTLHYDNRALVEKYRSVSNGQ